MNSWQEAVLTIGAQAVDQARARRVLTGEPPGDATASDLLTCVRRLVDAGVLVPSPPFDDVR